MKKTYLKTSLVLICTFFSSTLFAQDLITDNKSNTLFTMPSSLVSPKISPNAIGLTYPFAISTPTQFFYYKGNKEGSDTIHTVVKSKSLYLKGAVSNATGNSFDFSKYFIINPHLEFGYSHSIDFINNVTQLKTILTTWSAAVFADYQNFNAYDTSAKSLPFEKFKRVSPGFKIIGNILKKNDFAAAFSFSYQRGVNISALKAFQNVSSAFYIDNNVATNSSVTGYLKPFNVQNQYRLSIALPLFEIPSLDKLGNFGNKFGIKSLQIVPCPYYYIVTPDFDKIDHTAGITLNLLPYSVSNGKNFSFSSAFNIGYNLIDSSNKTNQRYVFLAGTFSFGKPTSKGSDSPNPPQKEE